MASIEENVKQFKCSLNQILPTLFTLRDNESRIIAVMSSNVDDLLYGYLPEGAEAMNYVLQQFLVGKEEQGTFRFCGKEFRQYEDFGIDVTAKDNTERVQPITCDTKHGLTRKATADERFKARLKNAYVRDLRECFKIVVYATSTSTRGIYCSPDSSWDDAVVATSVTPVSVKNKNNSTESLRTSNHNKLISQHWHLVMR